ncbi:MAG: outer membrane protein assembly factor BamE [Rhodobacteraceae bacterium]|nr:outer membrane protein assembly factor BamE [Paracoccaceae bacterium]
MAAGLLLVVLAGCAATFMDHGYVPADVELAQVHVGDSRETVEKTIGHPSVEGMEQPNAWYYVQSRWRYFGPVKPKEINRQVVAISFTPAGKVANIERFGLERGEVVVISQRVTTSTVKGVGLLQQLFNDLGRFNPGQFLPKSSN